MVFPKVQLHSKCHSNERLFCRGLKGHHKLWINNFVSINCAWFCFGGKWQPNHRKKPSQVDIIFWKVHGFLRVSLNCWLKIVVHPPKRISWNHGANIFCKEKKWMKATEKLLLIFKISKYLLQLLIDCKVTKPPNLDGFSCAINKVGLTSFSIQVCL